MDGRTLLIVDPDDDARHILDVALRHAGFAPVFARSGEEAMRAARADLPALIITDLYIPVGSMRCVLQAIRRDPALRAVPVIAHTAHVAPPDLAWAHEWAVDAVIPKPVDLRRLLAAAARLAAREPPSPRPPGRSREIRGP